MSLNVSVNQSSSDKDELSNMSSLKKMNFYFHCISNKYVQKHISASRSVFIMFSCKISIR